MHLDTSIHAAVSILQQNEHDFFVNAQDTTNWTPESENEGHVEFLRMRQKGLNERRESLIEIYWFETH